MQSADAADEPFLYERILAHECCGGTAGGTAEGTAGFQLELSPDGHHLAVIEPSQHTAATVPLDGLRPRRFHATSVVAVGKAESSTREKFLTAAWSADSQELLVAGSTGSLYLLSRSAVPLRVWLARGLRLPWSRPGIRIAGLAWVSPTALMLVTNTAAIYTVPLEAPPEQWANLKPIKQQGVHADVRVCGYHHASKVLVLAGLGAEGSKCPGVCVSLWRWQDKGLSSVPFAWHGKPQVSQEQVNSVTPPWSISFSPAGDYVAVAPAPHRLVIAVLPAGMLVHVAGNPSPGVVSLNALMQSPCSVAWVSHSSLALTTPGGALGLAQLQTLNNLLGLPGDGPQQCAPGCAVSVKREGEDSGLLVLEPGSAPPVAWRLTVLARRTPEQLLAVLLAKQDWARATQLCRVYGLDADGVHKARWTSAVVSEALIHECLACMYDQRWACEQVVDGRCAEDASIQRSLLGFGMDASVRMCQQLEDAGDSAEGHWWRRMRLRLLRHIDRLDLLLALLDGLYDSDAFLDLRDAPLVDVSQAWAALGSVAALTTLLSAAPCILGPHLLTLLNCLPETLDPRTYSQLLPRADGVAVGLPSANKAPRGSAAEAPTATPVSLDREPDWVESSLTGRELLADGFPELCEATECMAVVTHGVPPRRLPALPPEEVEAWYCERAMHLDITSRQLGHAVALLELGAARGAAAGGRVSRTLRHARVLQAALPALSTGHLGCDGPSWLMTLDLFSSLAPLDQLRTIMQSSTEETLQADVVERAAPFLLSQPSTEARQLLTDFLARELSSRPGWCAALVAHEANRPRLLPDLVQLVQAVCQAIARSRTSEAWGYLQDMLEELQQALDRTSTAAATAGDAQKQHACASAAAALQQAVTWVESGALLSRHDIHMTAPELQQLDQPRAHAVVQRVLARAERVGGKWSNNEWSGVWADLRQLQGGALVALPAQDMMQQYLTVLLRAGRLDLAKAYLNGSGSVPITPEACAALVVAAAGELLAGASHVHDTDVERAHDILMLAPSADKAVEAELSLVEVLQRLDGQGVQLAPAQVKQFQSQQAGAGGLELLAYLLEAGRPQRLAAQLDLVLEVVALLGLDSSPQQLNQAKLMIARACGSAGDWDVTSGLLVGLVDEGIEPAAPLAAQLARSKAGRLLGGEARSRLLSFAALHAGPEELPALMDELLGAQAACIPPEVQEAVSAEPDYHLRRALAQAEHSLPLPSYGDVPLALAALTAAPTTSGIQQLVSGLVGEPGSMSLARFATLQRGLLVGIHSLALRAMQLGGAPAAQLQQLQQLHATVLLQQAEAAQLSSPEAQAAVQAAQGLAQTLQAATDGRSLRSAVPGAQPTDLLGGDPQQRTQALLQQAGMAGQQAAGVGPDGTQGMSAAASVASGQKLLDHALQLCKQYGVSTWAARLEFVCAAFHAAPHMPAELKQQLLNHWQQLLQPTQDQSEPAPLLLATVSGVLWPTTPAASASHLSLLLALLLACLPGCGPPAPASATLQRLTKLADLLDKAGGALRGLSLRQILTPLLRNALGAMQLPEPPVLHSNIISGSRGTGGSESSGSKVLLIMRHSAPTGLDPELPALITEAQAAVYAYSSQQTVGATGKLLKAMQAIFSPPTGASAEAPEAASQAKALSSLPITLPYFCLLCKSCCSHSGSGVPAGIPDAQAWASIRDACLSKVSPGQLRAWLDFMIMGAKQPLSASVAGRLAPVPLSAALQLEVVRDGLQHLPECAPGSGAGAGAGKPLPDVTLRLLQQYGRLKVHTALNDSALPQQVRADLEGILSRACQEAVSSKGQAGASADQLLGQVTKAQLAQGSPVADVLSTVHAAWPDAALASVAFNPCGYPADLSPTQIVVQGLEHRLTTLLDTFTQQSKGAGDAGAAASPTAPDASASQGLRMLLQSLAPPADSGANEGDGAEGVLDGVRQRVMQDVAACVEGLEAWQYSQPEAAALLQVHVSLVSGQTWPGWQGDSSSVAAGGAVHALSSRVLLAATLGHLGDSWSALPELQPQDLESVSSATACFLRVLGDADTLARQQALVQLLSGVWQWGVGFPAVDTTDGQPHEEGNATPMHACWRAVLQRSAEAQHYALFMDTLGMMPQPPGTAMLTREETEGLAQELGSVSGQDSTHAALAAMVLLLSSSSSTAPDAEHQAAVAQLFQQHGPRLLLDAQRDVAHSLASVCLGHTVLLQGGLAAEARQAVEQALVGFALRESSDRRHPLLLPCTVAQLCMCQRFAVAASLAAHACRWTTALRALGGSLHFLDHFLASVAHSPVHPEPDASAPSSTDGLRGSLASWLAQATKAVREGCQVHG